MGVVLFVGVGGKGFGFIRVKLCLQVAVAIRKIHHFVFTLRASLLQ